MRMRYVSPDSLGVRSRSTRRRAVPVHPDAEGPRGSVGLLLHESHEVDGLEPLWIVDGTLIPVRDRKVSASARNYRCSGHVQVVIDADTHLWPPRHVLHNPPHV